MAVIALLELLPTRLVEAIRRHVPCGAELRAVTSADPTEAQRLAAEAEVLVVWDGPLPSATLAAARGARLAQVCDRRPRGVDFFTARRRGLPVAGPGRAGARAAAEHALHLALAGLRGAPLTLRDASAETAPHAPHPGRGAAGLAPPEPSAAADAPLHGRGIGLYGADPVASELAKMALALGSEATYWSTGQSAGVDMPPGATRAAHRYEVLAGCDVVSLHLPPTPDQRAAIGRETLRLLRRTAVLVNVSSPELIDEVSLYQALANGRLGAAMLDSLTDPAAPPNHPLRTRPDVLITPRLASATPEAIDELAQAAMANAERVLAGQEPLDRWA